MQRLGNGVIYCLGMEMIGRRYHLKQSGFTSTKERSPLFLVLGEKSINLHYTLSSGVLFYHLTYHRTLSDMNTLPSGSGGPSRARDPYQYGISNTRTENNTTNNVHGSSNTNFANVSNSYNHTINVGVSEESARVQAWLSPLEPHARHQDVRNRRLDGVGDWVLRRNEFESWSKGQDSRVNPTLLCYGGEGAGKTYIR